MPVTRLTPVLLAALSALLLFQEARAESDALRNRWLWEDRQPPAWEVMAGDITLSPGETHLFPLPARCDLRLESLGNAPLDPHHLTLTLDTGNGLAREMTWETMARGPGVRVNGEDPLLARVTLSPESGNGVAFRVALAHWGDDPTPELYRDEVTLPLPTAEIVREAPRRRDLLHALEGGQTVTVEIDGPARLLLEHRVRWPDNEPRLDTFVRLVPFLDNLPLPALEFRPALETGPVTVAHAPETRLGTLERGYLELPAGPHRLRLTPSQGLYLRLLARRDGDLLGPNGREFGAEGAVHNRLLPRIRGEGAQPPLDVARTEAAALTMALDPARPEGALEAVDLLNRAGLGVREGEELFAQARQIARWWTRYRDLAPERGSGGELLWARFPQQRLKPPGEIDAPPPLDRRRLNAALERIPAARFVTLPGGETLTYALPPRSAPSQLRLAAERPEVPVTLELALDDGPGQRLHLVPGAPPLPAGVTWRATLTTAALAMAAPPEPLLQAGSAEWALTPGVSRVTLRSPAGAPPLRVALQLREAEAVTLTEAEFLAELTRIGGTEALWRDFRDKRPGDGLIPLWRRPLERWLDQQSQRFQADIAPPPPTTPGPGTRPAADDPLAALPAWRRAVAHAPRSGEAWQGLWTTLGALREPFLQERVLRGLVINGLATPAAREALLATSPDRLPSLLAWEITRKPTPAALNQLALALRDDGQEELALTAALMPPPETRNHLLVAALALDMGWLETFEQAVARLPREQESLWRGWAAWRMAEPEAARGHWRQAGTPGREVIDALAQGERLAAAGGTDAELSRWWSRHPGVWGWTTPPELVRRFAGVHDYASPITGKPLRLHLATREAPVTMAVNGPVRLRLEVRPVHPDREGPRLEGWSLLELDDRPWPMAINDTPPARELTPRDPQAPVAGLAVTREFDIPSGPHRVTVRADRFPLLVRGQVHQPRIRLANPPWPKAQGAWTPPPLAELESVAWRMEREPGFRPAGVVRAEELDRALPATPESASLMQRIRRMSAWSLVETVESSAGVRWAGQDTWFPESPASRVRAALLPPREDDARMLEAGSRMVLSLAGEREQRVTLDLELTALPFVPVVAMAVTVTVDDAPRHRVTLAPGRLRAQLPLILPPGEHVVALSLDDPVVGSFVRVALRDEGGRDLAWNAKRDRERLHQAATPEEPLVLNVEGPTWLRVDQWQPDGVRSRTMVVAPGWQQVRLAPSTGEGLYRVFQRRVADAPPVRARLPEPTPARLPREEPRPVTPPELPPPRAAEAGADSFDGVWSAEGRWVVRRDSGEGPGAPGLERFTQLSLAHRAHDPEARTFDQWGGLARFRVGGAHTWGVWAERRDLSPDRPFNLRYGGEIMAQEVENAGLESSLRLHGGLSRLDHLSPRVDNLVELSGFVRVLTLDGIDDQTLVDRDVYTDYLRDHKIGLVLSDTLSYSPWLDSLASLRVRVGLNEDPFSPDRVGGQARWEQLLGDARLDARYGWQRYLADADRAAAVERYGPEVTMAVDLWPRERDRLELTLNWQREESSGDNTGFAALTWHFGDNRLRAIAPGEEMFEELRYWTWPRRDAP